MHFEFLVEDASGARAMDILCSKMFSDDKHSMRIHSYYGGGKDIPKKGSGVHPSKRNFFGQLPRLLRGYGEAFHKAGASQSSCVIVICDLDDDNETDFLAKLNGILEECEYKPIVRFCLSIEELEAWYLGDISAINHAYPKAKKAVLQRYKNDAICGTWELLADAVYPGGRAALKQQRKEGSEKFCWAERIAPFMDIRANQSPSFNGMIQRIDELRGCV